MKRLILIVLIFTGCAKHQYLYDKGAHMGVLKYAYQDDRAKKQALAQAIAFCSPKGVMIYKEGSKNKSYSFFSFVCKEVES